MNTICLAMDRLHVGYLGAYGNTWVRTPALDRVAAEGVTFDAAFLESPNREQFCEACWLGRHAFGPRGAFELNRSLPALLSARSVATRLVTDDPAVAAHPLAASFGEIIKLDLPMPVRPADAVEDTLLGQCFAQVLESLETTRVPFFHWCHFRALEYAWDAPLELRRIDWDEDDPEPPQAVAVPNRMLPASYDPDELLGYRQVYAAQVCVLDACVEVLLDWLRTSAEGRETLLVVASPRGFPLGEHLRVGAVDNALYTELTHIPLLIRFPDGLGGSDRAAALVQPSDLARTLAEWHGVPDPDDSCRTSLFPLIRGSQEAIRQCVGILGSEQESAFVTPAWYTRQSSTPELFLRPDDRWCANDVADRCSDVVESLSKAFSDYRQAVHLGHLNNFPALPPELLEGPD